MGLRNILQGTEPALRKKSRVVTEFNPRLHKLLDDMHETMLASNGLGLAAPQVGVLRRVVLVVDTNVESGDESDESNGSDEPVEKIIELINPEIINKAGGVKDGSEGCLSMPGVFGMVRRPVEVTVRAQDRYGETFEVSGVDLTARAFCHEIDHLNGVLFTDLATRLLTEDELNEMATQEFIDERSENDNT